MLESLAQLDVPPVSLDDARRLALTAAREAIRTCRWARARPAATDEIVSQLHQRALLALANVEDEGEREALLHELDQEHERELEWLEPEDDEEHDAHEEGTMDDAPAAEHEEHDEHEEAPEPAPRKRNRRPRRAPAGGDEATKRARDPRTGPAQSCPCGYSTTNRGGFAKHRAACVAADGGPEVALATARRALESLAPEARAVALDFLRVTLASSG